MYEVSSPTLGGNLTSSPRGQSAPHPLLVCGQALHTGPTLYVMMLERLQPEDPQRGYDGEEGIR